MVEDRIQQIINAKNKRIQEIQDEKVKRIEQINLEYKYSIMASKSLYYVAIVFIVFTICFLIFLSCVELPVQPD